MANPPAPREGIVLTHFVVSDDVARSRRFYTEVLGGEVVREGEPTVVALGNGWIIINVGGGPTDDKPTVTLKTPPDPNAASSFRLEALKAYLAEQAVLVDEAELRLGGRPPWIVSPTGHHPRNLAAQAAGNLTGSSTSSWPTSKR
jgi:catechol 2,3-dioxygenase-like lactoylglutathione lyase family enzyme